MVPEGWPTGGAITLTKGMQRVEIEETSPDDGGTLTRIDHVWSLKISDTFFESKRYLGRWPSGWRLYDVAHPGGAQAELGSSLEAILGELFGLK